MFPAPEDVANQNKVAVVGTMANVERAIEAMKKLMIEKVSVL